VKILKQTLLILSLIFLAGFGSSCGYSTRSALPGSLRTIYVEPFKNKIDFTNENRRNVYFPLIEVNARNAIVNRIQFDGNVRLTEPAKAAMILKGSLVAYERQPIRYDENENVKEYRVQVVVDLRLWDTKENLAIWEEPGFVGETTYFPTGSLATTEAAALDKAMEDLGRRVVERIVENW